MVISLLSANGKPLSNHYLVSIFYFFPINYDKVLHIPGGCLGFLPQTVFPQCKS